LQVGEFLECSHEKWRCGFYLELKGVVSLKYKNKTRNGKIIGTKKWKIQHFKVENLKVQFKNFP
jgi:hypothetical protein